MVVWFENSSGTHERCLQNGKILHWYSIWKYINIDQNAEKFSTNPNDWIANKTTTIYRIARRVVAHFVTLFLSFSLSFCFLPLLFHTKHCSEYVCCVFSTISLWSVKLHARYRDPNEKKQHTLIHRYRSLSHFQLPYTSLQVLKHSAEVVTHRRENVRFLRALHWNRQRDTRST